MLAINTFGSSDNTDFFVPIIRGHILVLQPLEQQRVFQPLGSKLLGIRSLARRTHLGSNFKENIKLNKNRLNSLTDYSTVYHVHHVVGVLFEGK